jgi:hypothetical protein
MRELYSEELAIHVVPESCVGDPRGRSEALTGVRTGWAIEPRYKRIGVPTRSDKAEGNIVGGVIREPLADPARSLEPGHVRELSMRENREVRRSPVRKWGRAVRGRPRP